MRKGKLEQEQQIGKLTLLERYLKQVGKRRWAYWTCKCWCGQKMDRAEQNLSRTNGFVQSCGCYLKQQKELIGKV